MRLQTYLAVALLVATTASAKNEIGTPTGGGASIQWQVSVSGHRTIRLTVVGPDGEPFVRTFEPGQNPAFRVLDLESPVADGQYTYELRVEPKVPPSVKKQLDQARSNDDDVAVRKILKEARLDRSVVQSGTITIVNNSIVSPSAVEADANDTGTVAASSVGRGVRANDQVIPDDLIVQSSICAGFDCVDGESFGFDTLRLKENNLRINFDDTSSSTGFAANDWRLIANESASGGANNFVLEDSTAARNPVVVEAAAPANALYVDSSGNIGLQTATPGLDLHIATGDTPAARLEQTNTGGFTAQTWDIGGNEANFFVRDLTGGSKLSFRIRPGAPTSSIDIASSGAIGFGTASPVQRFHFLQSADVQTNLQVQNETNATNANAAFRALANTTTIDVKSHSPARTLTRWGRSMGGWGEMIAVASSGLAVGTQTAAPLILGTNSKAVAEIDANGNGMTINGNFTVTGVKNFAVVDPDDKKKALYYTALEGPEAGTYIRGSAKTIDGEVTIELPSYFSKLTESERLTVQLTPTGAYARLYVAEKSPSRLVIKVVDGDDAEFDYVVQGVRKGYLDYEVERVGKFPAASE